MATSAILLSALGVFITLLAATAYVFTRMLRPGKSNGSASSAPLNLKPMDRLLAADDFEFLARQPGFRPQMLSSLRARRAALFQSYLSSVEVEFHRLHTQLRILILQSGIDNPAVARSLVEQRMLFSVRLVQVRYRLFLFRLGYKGMPSTGIADAIQQMREQVAQLQVALPTISSVAA